MSKQIWHRRPDAGLTEDIRQALEEVGLPWHVEQGSKHRKLKINGRLVGIMPLKGVRDCKAHRNLIASIRRIGRV